MGAGKAGSDPLAIISLVVSGAALGWTMYRDLADRGKLRVSCYIGQVGQMGVGVIADNLLVWSITNIGRQPIMVSQIGGLRAKKQKIWIVMAPKGDQLPKMLKPGEYCTLFTDDLRGIQPDVTRMWAVSTLNRRYEAPAQQVRDVMKQISEKRLKGELRDPA